MSDFPRELAHAEAVRHRVELNDQYCLHCQRKRHEHQADAQCLYDTSYFAPGGTDHIFFGKIHREQTVIANGWTAYLINFSDSAHEALLAYADKTRDEAQAFVQTLPKNPIEVYSWMKLHDEPLHEFLLKPPFTP